MRVNEHNMENSWIMKWLDSEFAKELRTGITIKYFLIDSIGSDLTALVGRYL